MNRKLIEIAEKKKKKLDRLRKDERYQKVIGKLKHANLLDAPDIPEYRRQVFLEDALWVGQIEPRVFELLPSILIKMPKFFSYLELPEDLEQVVRQLRTGQLKKDYQGIPAKKVSQWLSWVGKKDVPRVMKSFRLRQNDIALIEEIAKKQDCSQSEAISKALQEYRSGVK